ncbi:MAG: hypothetical protein RIR70_1930 [Pseudomonadota bacterium]
MILNPNSLSNHLPPFLRVITQKGQVCYGLVCQCSAFSAQNKDNR